MGSGMAAMGPPGLVSGGLGRGYTGKGAGVENSRSPDPSSGLGGGVDKPFRRSPDPHGNARPNARQRPGD